MDKPTEILRSGWLVKSPPEKQMNRKFMPANWKRRYFVLQEAVSNIPGHSASLIYYKDERCRQPKGSIDLEHCEEVLSSLDSPHYTHLFALRTVHKRKNEARTYYLAADTAPLMNTWVESLCVVLGLKESQEEEPAPPATLPRPSQSQPLQQPIAIPPPIQPIPTHPPTLQPKQTEEYIPLDNCFSDRNSINDNLSSIPDGFAPPKPPLPADRVEYDHPTSRLRTVDPNDNVYKSPPSNRPTPNAVATQSQHEALYNVPPKRDHASVDYINQQDMPENDEIYNVPPPHHQSVYNTPPPMNSRLKREPSERDSNSSNGSKHSQLNTDDSGLGSSMDNITRGMRDIKTSQYRPSESQEIYNVPPPTRPAVPADNHKLLHAVPPPASNADQRPKEPNRAQYVNLYGGAKPEVPLPNAASEYDIPPPSKDRKRTDVEMLGLRPPPPSQCVKVTAHQYVNAGTGVVNVTPPMRVPLSPSQTSSNPNTLTRTKPGYIPMNQAAGSSPDAYLPMAPSPPHEDSYTLMGSQHSPVDSYLPMDRTGGSPPDSYLPMNNMGGEYPRRMQRGSRGSGSHSPDDYLPMDNNKDRASTDSTYQILPPGVHPVSGTDYDNRLSQLAEYSTGPSNRPVPQAPQPQERDSIYSHYPSNRPVEPKGRRGLDAYVPTSSPRPSRPLDAYPPAPAVRESDMIYDFQPSNRPVPMPDKLPQEPLLPFPNRPSFNKERSRSFKRNIDTPMLPIKNHGGASDSSSDEDSDDPNSSSSNDKSMDSIQYNKPLKPQPLPQAKQLKRSLNSTPPTPTHKRPGEIEYLDLGLGEPPGDPKERSPVSTRAQPPKGNTTPTEYHEIDFMKTEALSATKKAVESKRKSSEKGVDE